MKKTALISIVGILIGTLSGFLYYTFIGCKSGTCPLQSNAYFMSAYGGFAGLVLGNLVQSYIIKPKIKNEKDFSFSFYLLIFHIRCDAPKSKFLSRRWI